MEATITLIPCCNPGESIIFIDTAPLISSNLINGAVYKYVGPAGITGQPLGPLGLDMIIIGQCYTLVFGQSAATYPTLPSTVTYTNFASANNSCLNQDCVNACILPPVEQVSNRYLKFVPCCDTDNPVYFRPPSTIPTNGVAIYSASISSNPYLTTDIFGNPDNPLLANLCYSITTETVGPGMHVTNVTAYNNLQIAPNNTASNYVYVSTNTSCVSAATQCPDCKALCFTLWSCDGSQPLFTTSTDLTTFVGQHITVSSVDPHDNIVDLCVFVQDSSNDTCTNSIDVIYDVEDPTCECDCTCYTILGSISRVEWIDCNGDYQSESTPLSPFQICAGAYPLAYPSLPTNPLQLIDNGSCIESTILNEITCEEETVYNCEAACYKLEDCLDDTNVLYSTSPSLLGPAILEQVVTIAGYTECWKVLPSEICDCPIVVSILTVSNCCEACLPNINYKLTLCENSSVYIYTSDDLSLFKDRVVRREDCPEECWIVSQIDGNIPSTIPITVIEDYIDCELCNRIYYKLEDCLNIKNDIITYTDLSTSVGKVITLDWCPETCWQVSETIEDDNAGIISDILNTYLLCLECLTNAPCICSTIKNYNLIPQTYKYLDCFGAMQTITLDSKEQSERLCLIRWYVPEPCDEFIITITSSTGVVTYTSVYQNSLNHPGPVLVNNKPTWKDAGNNLYIYYDGTKWILSKNLAPLVFPSVYTTIGFINCNGDSECPIGTWEQSSSIPNQSVYKTTELKYIINYFGKCTNGVCPPKKNKQKSVKPGYNTPGCEAWKYEEISCRAADAMYKQVLELRYGISNCCPDEDNEYVIKKELIDLASLYDPDYPCAKSSCGCGCSIPTDCSCN